MRGAIHKRSRFVLAALLFFNVAASFFFISVQAETIQLLNVSYDPTREFFKAYNDLFYRFYRENAGVEVKISQSHGGSGKQARSVIEGLRADVVTLALAYDIQMIAEHRLLNKDWETLLPLDASPYTSAIIFLVRKGNPKGIRDWSDLVKPGVSVITPNPKTSGGARWNFLAMWGYITIGRKGTESEALDFTARLFRNVPVLDSGARGATTTFVQKEIGDVYITWENEAFLALKEYGQGKFERVYPSISILAQPCVSVVDRNVDRRGPAVRAAAAAYLKHLYSPEAQELIAQQGYRPSDATAIEKHRDRYPAITLFSIKQVAGNWRDAQKKFFGEDGVFDRIYRP